MTAVRRVAIVGAGPVGIDAALTAIERGFAVRVFEASSSVGGHLQHWRHVRMFTPWRLDLSAGMQAALLELGIELDAETCPTGADFLDRALEPLATRTGLRDVIRFDTSVRAIGRRGLLKHEEIGTPARADRPFRLLTVDGNGRERVFDADIVLDCTGLETPNPLGDGGLPALGEVSNRSRISFEIPNIQLGQSDLRGTIMVVGSGHSAQTAVRDLGRAVRAGSQNSARVVWVVRGRELPSPDPSDPLPARRALLEDALDVTTAHPQGQVEVICGAVVEEIRTTPSRLDVTIGPSRRDGAEQRTIAVSRLIALTGKTGSHSLYRQLQIHQCYATEGPMKLAAALLSSSGAGGDCLDQTSHGADTLKNPEPDFFIVGSKSYGRRNDFLLRVGYQQVAEVFELV